MKSRLRFILLATILMLAGGGLASLQAVLLRILGIALFVAGLVLFVVIYYWLV